MSDIPQLQAWERFQLEEADQIDIICDAFEKAWTAGKRPLVEDYLDRFDGSTREQLLTELLLVDREYRVKLGESATRRDYQARFPNYSTVIDGLEFATIEERDNSRSGVTKQIRPSSGRSIAQFQFVEELGAGASGLVWKARDMRLQRIVAVKIPRQEIISMSERERFVREGQTCAQLRHPNIVAVYEVGEERGQVFIVSEYIDGADLRSWMRSHQLSFRDAAELAAYLAGALHHAHEQGVIHRDLKPANILMDREGRPHIADFGLAKWTENSTGLTIEGHIFGTPAYMSPEQARGDIGQINQRADVYGLGAILYEMITGNVPFTGDAIEIVNHVIHDEPRPPRTVTTAIPRDLETICLKAMEKDPARRYPVAQEMEVDLRRYLRGEPILARRVSLLEKGWRWIRRRPSVAAVVVLIFMVTIAGMTIASLRAKNYALQGYRQVRITTSPAGARVVLVPIDERTGEPNSESSDVIRPTGLTPLTTSAKPGRYFVEAVLPSTGDVLDFTEGYVTVPIVGEMTSTVRRSNIKDGTFAESIWNLGITIRPTKDIIYDMVAVPIDQDLRRLNPQLPALLYIDPIQSISIETRKLETPQTSGRNEFDTEFVTFQRAMDVAKTKGKRIPSAAEYDAVVSCIERRKLNPSNSDGLAAIEGLYDDVAEWTTTKYQFSGIGRSEATARLQLMMIFKGYGAIDESRILMRTAEGHIIAQRDAESPHLGYRCVRSGQPRFITRP